MRDKKPEYVICSAIHYDDGKIYVHQPRNIQSGFVVAGRRHHNCIITMHELSGKSDSDFENTTQGFLTSYDMFLNRQQAYELAEFTGQIIGDRRENTLYSENLY
jgi:hypothetical protein